MRLSDVLSKPPKQEFVQTDGFLINKKGAIGQQVTLAVGKVMLNYYCSGCEDIRTFTSKGKLTCVFVNKHIVSIDSVLSCGCGANVQAWFLVECEEDICGQAPRIRIIKRSEKLSNLVKINNERYGDYSGLLEKAERAFREDLGAGSIVYLRKAFEKVTVQTAKALGIKYKMHVDGNPMNFRALLEEVDKKSSIVPREFSNNRYKLFRELSGVVHGDYDENQGLKKYEPLHRLVTGILDNVSNSQQLSDAVITLGWEENTGGENVE